jgi:hypothetical protein
VWVGGGGVLWGPGRQWFVTEKDRHGVAAPGTVTSDGTMVGVFFQDC